LAHLVAVAICLAALVPFIWTEYFRDRMSPDWTAGMAHSGDLNDRRRMAACYEVGCNEVVAAPILACAWREIILEETQGSSRQDRIAADRACSRISQNDRETLERAEGLSVVFGVALGSRLSEVLSVEGKLKTETNSNR
jgi:hypothetical protein